MRFKLTLGKKKIFDVISVKSGVGREKGVIRLDIWARKEAKSFDSVTLSETQYL